MEKVTRFRYHRMLGILQNFAGGMVQCTYLQWLHFGTPPLVPQYLLAVVAFRHPSPWHTGTYLQWLRFGTPPLVPQYLLAVVAFRYPSPWHTGTYLQWLRFGTPPLVPQYLLAVVAFRHPTLGAPVLTCHGCVWYSSLGAPVLTCSGCVSVLLPWHTNLQWLHFGTPPLMPQYLLAVVAFRYSSFGAHPSTYLQWLHFSTPSLVPQYLLAVVAFQYSSLGAPVLTCSGCVSAPHPWCPSTYLPWLCLVLLPWCPSTYLQWLCFGTPPLAH